MARLLDPPVAPPGDPPGEPPADLLPAQLEFRISGSPFAPAYRLTWSAGKLLYEAVVADPGPDESEERTWELFVPSADQWRRFWDAVERAGVWDWAPEYLAGRGDGTSWRLELHRGTRGVTCTGLGAYPGSPDSTPSPAFRDFLAALRLLVEGRRLR